MLTKTQSSDRIFADIEPIRYEGPKSDNMLAFRHYDAEREVLGRKMKDHLRLAVCYWHSFHWPGHDIFGAGTFQRPWNPHQPCTQDLADLKLDNAFDFLERLGVPFFCFHDVDAMAVAETPAEHKRNLAQIAQIMKRKMDETGVKLLWGTANLFSHPRYAAGAATSPDPEIYAWGAFQVREMLETTHWLGGSNYVLWGGREGYETLLNTDLAREQEQAGRFLNLVVDYKHRIGFKGTILIEPKPQEPTKHQYDYDVATVYGFLKRFGLEKEVKLNIEQGHAILAGHSFEHELALASALGIFGSIDMNRNDYQSGWDTDQFPNNVPEMALAYYQVLQAGGFKSGGTNFDAKLRRQSLDPQDLLVAHIGGMDCCARGLKAAAKMIEDKALSGPLEERYAGWTQAGAQAMLKGGRTLEQISEWVLKEGLDPQPKSGRQEYLENIVNRYV
jgi:xylose isomerase